MKRIILFLILLFLIRCSNDDLNKYENQIDINLVSGLNLLDNLGDMIEEFGNSNVLNNNNFVFFPSPSLHVLSLYSMKNITKVWIRLAKPNKNYLKIDFKSILNPELYSENEIESGAELKFTNTNLSKITIDFRDLESGYYQIFC
ncbi:hypothetical protein [Tenacibaculum sp. C7A-26P2]|uniref:hypothetical protein n=1 Tax=Tenacibaculum sp. C7A-26P2 TaxID=3447504 RepID=UPI003F83947A